MANNFKNYPNRLGGLEKRESKSEEKGQENDKDLKETSQEFVEGVGEVVEGAETAEVAGEHISEKVGESRSKYSGRSNSTVSDTKFSTTADFPELDVMVIQISTRIKKELTALDKERKRYMKLGRFNPSKLNEIMSRIRELGDILADLATSTADNIKDLWKRFVQTQKKDN